jgi:hypothetical protein
LFLYHKIWRLRKCRQFWIVSCCKFSIIEKNIITKFDSSWLPLLSLETFVTIVKNTSLKVLILRGTQICPEAISALPSLQDHFQDLILFSIQQSGQRYFFCFFFIRHQKIIRIAVLRVH